MTSTHPARRALALALAVLALGGCRAADPEAGPSPTSSASPLLGASPADDRSAQVERELALLTEVLTAARDAAGTAAAADDVATGRAGLELTVHLLTADPATRSRDLDGDDVEPASALPPLLPGPEDAIGDDEVYPDVFSRVLTAARDAGAAGAPIVDLLRDPLTGDIGVWQGDAGAALAQVERVARTRDLDDLAASVADLPGAGAQALAYAHWGLGRRAVEDVRAAGERAVAHLQLGLDLLAELTR